LREGRVYLFSTSFNDRVLVHKPDDKMDDPNQLVTGVPAAKHGVQRRAIHLLRRDPKGWRALRC